MTTTTDPTELLSMFNAAEQGEDIEVKTDVAETPEPSDAGTQDEKDRKTDEKPAADPAADPAVEPAADGEAQPEGIATRDGKHVIPYSVLETERDKRAAAMARVAELEAENAKLKTAAPAPGTAPEVTASAAADMSEEEIAAISEDFPAIGKYIKSVQAANKAMKDEIAEVKARLAPVETRDLQEQRSTLQDAIDANPKLAHLQSRGGEAWESAVAIDAMLRGRADWAGKPMADRFKKVVAMVEADIGPIDVPSVKTPEAKAVEDAKKAADLARAAEEKAKASAVKRAPNSLSDLRSGESPALDERTQLENASAADLSAKFAQMTQDQLDAYLFNPSL